MATIPAILSDAIFALDALGTGSQVDVVAIFNAAIVGPPAPPAVTPSLINSILGDSNVSPAFSQMFAAARPLKATIRETSKAMDHPAEDGTVIADHRIINPIEIDLPLLVMAQDYAAMYSQIRNAFLDGTLLSVQTRTGVYQNLFVADMPHEETPDQYDAITIGLHLKQVQFVPSTATFSPALAADTDTVRNGLQQAASLGTKALAAASGLASYANIGKFR